MPTLRIVSFALYLFVLNALSPGDEYIVDNDDGFPDFVTTGTWSISASPGYNGGTYIYTHDTYEPSAAQWIPNIMTAGIYEVYTVFRTGTNRTREAPFMIHHDGGIDVVSIDMYGSGEIEQRYLGEYFFNEGTDGFVRLDNSGGAGFYIADVIRLITNVDYAPLIEKIMREPFFPEDGQEVLVNARITDDYDTTLTVTLYYTTDGVTSVTVPAFDDGLHHDGSAGDTIYGSSIPPFPYGRTVTYALSAFDSSNNMAVSPEEIYTVGCDKPTSRGIFILAGQSNASGRGELNTFTETPHSRVYMFGNDYLWKQAYEPVDDPEGQIDDVSNDQAVITDDRGHSFSLRAAKDVSAVTSGTLAIIPCPRGGTRLSQWARGTDPFDRSTLFGSCNYRRLVAAPDGVAAIWWYQGESDRTTANYVELHTALMADFRDQIGTNLPIIYVQLARDTDAIANSQFHAIAEKQRRMESASGYTTAIDRHYMVVAFDLPLNDSVHLNQTGQKELGRRVALATLEHVYEYDIDGTGPRLLLDEPLIHPSGDRQLIKVSFNQTINAAIDQYDNQFRAFDDGGELAIQNVERDPEDPSSVLITLPNLPIGTVLLSYGDIAAPGLGIDLPNVIKGNNGLPAPRFGPLTVTQDVSGISSWIFY